MIRSELLMKSGAVKEVAEAFRKKFPGKKPLIIDDTNTQALAEDIIVSQFDECSSHCFDAKTIYADDEHVLAVQRALEEKPDAVAVALGSGTINDLCKRASYVAGERPYMCIATAPSVDGFTSNGAAITDRGLKTTLPCPAPVLVVADTDILSNAPIDMIAAGYGDLAAKVPAGADWLIADALGIEKIVESVWDMVQPSLKVAISEPAKLRARDPQAAAAVFTGLIQTGFAMQEYFDSRPASGAEHLMSHVWEMRGSCTVGGKEASHGFKVAIGTLTTTAIMEELLKLSKSDVEKAAASYTPETWEERQKSIAHFVREPSVRNRQIEICRKKFLEGDALAARQSAIAAKWDELRQKIEGQIIPFAKLKEMFQTAGCPTEPSDICLSIENHRYGMRVAQMMRNRYTVVDLLYETGLLDAMIERIIDPAGTYFSAWDKA